MTRRNAHIVSTRSTPAESLIEVVMVSVDSAHTRRAYRRALEEFFAWHKENGEPPLNKTTVQQWRKSLVDAGLKPASVNQRLAALKKLAHEAADREMITPSAMAAIDRVKGVSQRGQRAGNWLTTEQAQQLLNAPDASTLKGLRDRAILAVALGCGLRRGEITKLTFEHIQQREGRWVIIDLVGKHHRVRSVPIPRWTITAIEAWQVAAGIGLTGKVFRPLHRVEVLIGEEMTDQTVYHVVNEYVKALGFGPLAPHDLRRTYAKLSEQGGARLLQIQLALGHASVTTTQTYIGTAQDLQDGPGDRLQLKLET